MENTQYPYYGMEYGNPSRDDPGKPPQSTSSSTSVQETVSSTVSHIELFDRRRLFEIDIASFVAQDATFSAVHSKEYLQINPVIAFVPDFRRASIHPSGITEKPNGVEDSYWLTLRKDDISTAKPRGNKSLIAARSTTAELSEEQVHTPMKIEKKAIVAKGSTLPEKEEKRDPTEMPFLDHLEEFRWALLKSIFVISIAMVIGWEFSDMFYSSITRLAGNADIPLIITKVMEPLMLKLQMAFVMGLILALPFVFYFIWGFISPGLYTHEKKWILPLIFVATFCFLIGASIAYFLMIPYMLSFLKNFIPPNVKQMITLGDFVSKILQFTLIFGVIFELPFISFILAKIGLLKHTWMSKYRNYAVVIIFIVAAVFTPPDPLSQIMMAIPLLVLYEISILVARFAGRKTLL